MTVDFLTETLLKGKWAERPFGWPFTWYWRSRRPISAPRWPGWRYDGAWLSADLAIWMAMLAMTFMALEWFFRRSGHQFYRRPSVVAVVFVSGIALFTTLANISVRVSRGPHPGETFSYGWPVEWCWRLHWSSIPAASYEEWGFSAFALARNIATWLLVLVATSWASAWLTSRFRPRFAWSVRVMLIVVALACVLCAFLSSARYRASEQDAIVAGFDPGYERSARDWADVNDFVYAEYRGPEWLDVIGAERLRRYIVGIRVNSKYSGNEAEQNGRLFNRLARLRGLRFVDVEADTHPRWPRENTPAMAWALGGMHQLQMVNFTCLDDFGATTIKAAHEYITAIGNLTRLRRLRLNIREESASELSQLWRLQRLKTLALSIVTSRDEARQGLEVRAAENSPSLLATLPVLPSLEELDVHDTSVNDADLKRLAAFEHLKCLNIGGTAITDRGLAQLSKFGSLEELAIDARLVTVVGLRALVLKQANPEGFFGPRAPASGRAAATGRRGRRERVRVFVRSSRIAFWG